VPSVARHPLDLQKVVDLAELKLPVILDQERSGSRCPRYTGGTAVETQKQVGPQSFTVIISRP
jgi:hypothetical protein